MSNKRYYWLKLNENFFEDDTIEWIEEQENGERYVLFYLKLCLRSLKDEGNLIRYVGEKLIPYDVNSLAKLTNTDKDTVAVSLKVFEEIGLIERTGAGEIYMKQINEMIGTETDAARRVRKHRARKKQLNETSEQELLQCNTDVTKCNTDIEIDIERDIEKDIELEVETQGNSSGGSRLTKEMITEIVDQWNRLGLQDLRAINSNTKRHTSLKARIDEYSYQEVLDAIERISSSSFLKGQNDRGWTITFDWLVRPNNFYKVLEGNYDDNDNGGGPNGRTQRRNEASKSINESVPISEEELSQSKYDF